MLLPALLYGYRARSVTLRREHRERVYENKVLRWMSGPKKKKWQEAWEDYIMMNFLTCILHETLLRWSDKDNKSGRARSMREMKMYTILLAGKLEGKRPLGRSRRGWQDNTIMKDRDSISGRINDRNFSLRHRVQTGSGAHPPSYAMIPGALTPGVMWSGREAEHSPPSSAQVHSPSMPSQSGA
jgi:hypothetical protein